MVEIRVAVADTTGAEGLVRQLVGMFDRSAVSFDRPRGEVTICSEPESRTVVLVLGAVEAWLAEDRAASATVSVGERSYTMVGPFPHHGWPSPDHEPPLRAARRRARPKSKS